MNFIEKSGKTVEDAVQAGLKELGKASSEVNIEVLEYGSPGLFGMFGKLARVRLTVKEQNEDFDFEMPVFSLNQQTAPKTKPARRPQGKPQEKPQAQDRPQDKPREAAPLKAAALSEGVQAEGGFQAEAGKDAQEEDQIRSEAGQNRVPGQRQGARQSRQKKPRSPKVEQPAPVPAPMEPAPVEDLPPLDIDNLSQDGKNAYEFLKELTRLMKVEVEIRLQESEGHLRVQMIGDTLGVLIGRRGETLDALQYLTSLQVNKGRSEYLRVTLDTEHYRAKREVALRRLAERMANRARRTGHRVALEPMNPYERRVLHSALQDNPYVTTHSEGEEPYRRVVITLK